MDTPISLETAIRTWAEAERRGTDGEMIAAEELIALHDGEFDDEARNALLRRLSLHPESAREYLDLANFSKLEPTSEDRRLTDQDGAGALVQMRARLGLKEPEAAGEAEETVAEVHPFPEPRPDVWRPRERLLAIAAALLAIAAAAWITTLHRSLERQTGPQYAAVIDVEVTRGPRTLEVPPSSEQILLVVHDVNLETFARGQLELTTDAGENLRTFDLAAPPDDQSLLYFAVPQDLLPGGTYRMSLFGLDSAERRLLKEYRFKVDVATSD